MHPQHDSIVLPKGVYRIWRQRRIYRAGKSVRHRLTVKGRRSIFDNFIYWCLERLLCYRPTPTPARYAYECGVSWRCKCSPERFHPGFAVKFLVICQAAHPLFLRTSQSLET